MTDYGRVAILFKADKAIRAGGGSEKAAVHFKFTCRACGERCMFQEENTLYERGECGKCGLDQVVETAGFLMVWRLKPAD